MAKKIKFTELTFEQMQEGAAGDVRAFEQKCFNPERCHECGSSYLQRTTNMAPYGTEVELLINGTWDIIQFADEDELEGETSRETEYQCLDCKTEWKPSFYIGWILQQKEQTLVIDDNGLFITDDE